MTDKEKIIRTARLLRQCQNILFITGAGISADSGLPTYRGIGGLYQDRNTEEGMPIEMALSGSTFLRHPETTWKYIFGIEERCRGATFNRGHRVIADMENSFRRVWVLTQNVDGFHQAAGSRKVINIHGDIHELICIKCSWRRRFDTFVDLPIPPTCPDCRAIVRPDVVLFGEPLPADSVKVLMTELEKGFDMVFSVGTSSVFPYIIQPMLMASFLGKPTVEINPAGTEISHLVDIKIDLGAAEALNAIWSEYRKNNAAD